MANSELPRHRPHLTLSQGEWRPCRSPKGETIRASGGEANRRFGRPPRRWPECSFWCSSCWPWCWSMVWASFGRPRRRSDVDRRPEDSGPADPQRGQSRHGQWSVQFKTGNRERDPQRQDFHWVRGHDPRNRLSGRRLRFGADGKRRLLRRLKRIEGPDVEAATTMHNDPRFAAVWSRAAEDWPTEIAPIAANCSRWASNSDSRDQLLRLRYRKDSIVAALACPCTGTEPQTRQIAELRSSRPTHQAAIGPAGRNSNSGWPTCGGTWP